MLSLLRLRYEHPGIVVAFSAPSLSTLLDFVDD